MSRSSFRTQGLGFRWVLGRPARDARAGGRLVDIAYREWAGDHADVELCFPVVRDPLHQIQTLDSCAFVPKPNAHKDLIPTALLGDTSRSEAAAARVVPGNELTSCSTEKDAGRVVDFLIKVGVDANAGDVDGVTALMLAAKYGLLFIVRRLLLREADATCKDAAGNTAMHYARAYNQEAAAGILAEYTRVDGSSVGSALDVVENGEGLVPDAVRGFGPAILPGSHEKHMVISHLPKRSEALRVTAAL